MTGIDMNRLLRREVVAQEPEGRVDDSGDEEIDLAAIAGQADGGARGGSPFPIDMNAILRETFGR